MTQKKHILKTGRQGQCQCDLRCTNTAMAGKPFCKLHSSKCGRISPLSGFEPLYEPVRWNKEDEVRETHNCFSYAMNVHDPRQIQMCKDKGYCEAPFHQPGTAAGYRPFSSKRHKTCPNIVLRLLGDNPGMSMIKFEGRCPPHTSKIALVVDPNEDYHFLRQDSNMYWSHKPGAKRVTNMDAKGSLIYDPRLAHLKYDTEDGVLDYSIFCGYLCAPRDSAVFLKSGGAITQSSSSYSARPFRTRYSRKSLRDHT